VRKLSGLAAADPEIRQVLSQVEQRLPLLTRLVERLAEADHLAAGRSKRRAVDVLRLLSSFEAFDQLFTARHVPWKRSPASSSTSPPDRSPKPQQADDLTGQ
jgi:hypothetical protein